MNFSLISLPTKGICFFSTAFYLPSTLVSSGGDLRFHSVWSAAENLEIIYSRREVEGQQALDGEEAACHPLRFANASYVSAGLSAIEAMPNRRAGAPG